MDKIMVLEYERSWKCGQCHHKWNSPAVLLMRGKYYLIHGHEIIKLAPKKCALTTRVYFANPRFIEIEGTNNALLIKTFIDNGFSRTKTKVYKMLCFDGRITENKGGLIKLDNGDVIGIVAPGSEFLGGIPVHLKSTANIFAINQHGHSVPFTTSIGVERPECWLYFEIGGGENVYLHRNYYAELGPPLVY